jgi:hypothetical protein
VSDVLIPERTIDAWMSSSITAVDPNAMVWAPTPPAQNQRAPNYQPWDVAVEAFGERKLLIFEDKCLLRTPAKGLLNVPIELGQLWLLAQLEHDGLPVFYGLPVLPRDSLPRVVPQELFTMRAGLRIVPPFSRWQRAPAPSNCCVCLAFEPHLFAGRAQSRWIVTRWLNSRPSRGSLTTPRDANKASGYGQGTQGTPALGFVPRTRVD